jgi:DNA-binding MurR/RpiR family transcriptional regulator
LDAFAINEIWLAAARHGPGTLTSERRTLSERMRAALPGMSPGERRIVRLCLGVFAPEQIATISTLAERAAVSPPTVLRCLGKIGFERFSDFRDVALEELEAKHESALMQMSRQGDARREPRGGDKANLSRFRDSAVEAVRSTFDRLDMGEFGRAAQLLADGQRRQAFTGGRFSHSVAELLFAHIHLVRPGCELIDFTSRGRPNRLADMGRGHVLTVFDFRRYQRDTVEFARAVKLRRAKLVLLTDQWMSPVADWADAVLVAEVRSASPFDTLTPALALVEALIAQVRGLVGAQAVERLAKFETDDGDFEWNPKSGDGTMRAAKT